MAKRISRRTILRGTGAALALPWLETMASAAPATGALTLSEPPLRMLFMYMPNGTVPEHWTPAGSGEDFEITPELKPLESLKSEILLLENLWNAKTVGRNGHWPKVPAWLSGGYVERTSGDDLDSGGTSIDQLAAQKIGDRTMLPSFELGLEATRTGIDTAGGGFSAHVWLVHLLARSAYAGSQRDHSAACLRPPVPLQQIARNLRSES